MNDLENDLSQVSPTVRFWFKHIDAYESKASKWEKKGEKIVNRYMAEKQANQARAKYNILWSNVQTLMPALYDKQPKPNIERRFSDKDDVGRVASDVLERSASYFIDEDEFNDKLEQIVLDMLLPGRGTAWVRYVPTIDEVQPSAPEGEQISDDSTALEATLRYEDVVYDYVHWGDFGHNIARTWQEVRCVWRIVFMTRAALKKRFGEDIGLKIPLNAKSPEFGKGEEGDRAAIYELWDKDSRKVYWLCKDYDEVLDEQEDPLKLKGFFPCPRPLYSTLANSSLFPAPDFEQYFDQARELDVLTGRIDLILQAMRVAGVYDGAAEGVQRLISEQVENVLIPIANWAVFGDKGGLKGVVDWFPVDQLVNVVQQLYQAREAVKQDMYEITGMSDIIRGASNPSETATAQQIKGQYANLRLGKRQKDVARFCRDLVVITVEIVANIFSLDTIKQISGIKLLTAVEKQQIGQQQAQAQAMAQQSGQQPPTMPEEMLELMDKPTWEEVDALIRDNMVRCFRINVETDSTIKADQDAEKQARNEFLMATGGFIKEAINLPPDLQPLAMDMLQFGIQGFKAGRELESAFETARKKIAKKADMPPQPSAEDKKAEMDAQMAQQTIQMEAQKMQFEARQSQQAAQLEIQKLSIETQARQQEIAAEAKRLDIEAAIKMKELEIKSVELLIKQAELGIEQQRANTEQFVAQNPPQSSGTQNDQ